MMVVVVMMTTTMITNEWSKPESVSWYWCLRWAYLPVDDRLEWNIAE
jgi:hypothetical protein